MEASQPTHMFPHQEREGKRCLGAGGMGGGHWGQIRGGKSSLSVSDRIKAQCETSNCEINSKLIQLVRVERPGHQPLVCNREINSLCGTRVYVCRKTRHLLASVWNQVNVQFH